MTITTIADKLAQQLWGVEETLTSYTASRI
jgi:hypothetical protein